MSASGPQTGRLITLEGVEGLGKSTLLPVIREHLLSKGIRVCSTREPGGTPLGEKLRAVVLETGESVVAEAEALIMFASRAQHVADVIRPALSRGEFVLCDRFVDASFAYQGGGRELGSEKIAALEQWVLGGLQPDLTVLLDADREVSVSRMQRRRAADRIEREGDDFFERVRDAYLARARQQSHRFAVIDAAPDVDTVSAAVKDLLDQMLERWSQ